MLNFIGQLNSKYWILILLLIIVVILIILKLTFKTDMNTESFMPKRIQENYSAHADIQDLSELNTDDKTIIFVKFYAPWCGYCTKMQPEWKKLYSEFDNKEVNGSMVKIRQVDCDNHPKIAEHFNVSGYPTLMIIKPNNKQEECNCDRTYKGMKNYLISNC